VKRGHVPLRRHGRAYPVEDGRERPLVPAIHALLRRASMRGWGTGPWGTRGWRRCCEGAVAGRSLQNARVSCYMCTMTKMLRDAIAQVERLPEGEQDAAAVAMLDYLAHRRDLRVSDEDLAEIRRRRADPNRKLVSHEEARARIGRLGA